MNDSGSRTLADIIPDNARSVEEVFDGKIIKGVIVEALSSLSKREEMVLRLRFGITDINEFDQNITEA